MDVLTDVLRTLRLRGTVYFQADFCAPWGMDIKGGSVANFHVVVRGNCWVRSSQLKAALPVSAGDLIVFPHGDRHALLHAPDGDALPAETVLSSARGTTPDHRTVYGGQGSATTLICGHFECERAGGHPLLSALPGLIHISQANNPNADWMTTATQLTLLESASDRQGSAAVVDRLAEILLIQVVRSYMEQHPTTDGFLVAISDVSLSAALSLIHSQPAHPWSVHKLARKIGMSRSAFAARFKEVMGISPMQYLTHWRMQKARELFLTEDHSVATVAELVGYQGEWSFAKAFKRIFGVGPGSVRREARQIL